MNQIAVTDHHHQEDHTDHRRDHIVHHHQDHTDRRRDLIVRHRQEVHMESLIEEDGSRAFTSQG
jgi:hypothetical protein